MDTPRRLDPQDDPHPMHAMLVAAFAYMDGVIDPPSSLARLAPADLLAPGSEAWVIGTPPRACGVLTPQPGTLYLGKLAVAAGARGQGLARRLVDLACARARALNLPSVTLQTRVELTGNQAAFQAMGFTETARTAHPGFDRPTSITYTLRV